MFCPECGSKLDNGYCSRCRVIYHAAVKKGKICPQCRRGTLILVGDRTAGLLFLPVGVKSKTYKCTSCGYETSERDFGTLRNDKEFQQAKKDVKNKMKKKIKNLYKR